MKKNQEKMAWDRAEGETIKAFKAFCVYRDLGPERSLEKTGEIIGKSGSHMGNFSAEYNWRERAAAYDEYNDRVKREKYEMEIQSINETHKEMVKKAREAAIAPINSLLGRLEQIRNSDFDGDSLDGLSLEKLMDLTQKYIKPVQDIIKLERLLYGMSTENVETKGRVKHEISKDIRVVNEYIESMDEEELLGLVRTARQSTRTGREH